MSEQNTNQPQSDLSANQSEAQTQPQTSQEASESPQEGANGLMGTQESLQGAPITPQSHGGQLGTQEAVPVQNHAPAPDVSSEQTENGEEMVSIERKKLEAFMDRFDSMQKQIDMLTFSADETRVQRWKDQNKEVGNPIVRIRKILVTSEDEPNGVWKYIVAWTQMVRNDAFIEANTNRRIEDQRTQLVFNDNTTKEIRYADIAESIQYVSAEVLSTQKASNGSEKLTVRTKEENPVELTLDLLFVN